MHDGLSSYINQFCQFCLFHPGLFTVFLNFSYQCHLKSPLYPYNKTKPF